MSRDKTLIGQVPSEPFLQALEGKKGSMGVKWGENVCHSTGGVSICQEYEAGGSARALWLESGRNKAHDSGSGEGEAGDKGMAQC